MTASQIESIGEIQEKLLSLEMDEERTDRHVILNAKHYEYDINETTRNKLGGGETRKI